MFNTDSFLNQMKEIETDYKHELSNEEVDSIDLQTVDEKITTAELKERIEDAVKENDINQLEEILELIVKTDKIKLVKNKIDLMFYTMIIFSIEYKIEPSVMFSMAKDNYFIVNTTINLLKIVKNTPELVEELVINGGDKFKSDLDNTVSNLPLNLLTQNKVININEKYFILYYEMIQKDIKKSLKLLIDKVITSNYIQEKFEVYEVNELAIITLLAKELLIDKSKLKFVYNNLLRRINEKL